MKMSRDERWLDICPIQFTSNRPRSRAFPDRVLDIHDRRHQCHKAKIALDHCQQCADPAAVTGGQHAELATASFAQSLHQLPQFDHPLAQSFRIANEVRCDGKLAIPVAARHTRIMIRQVNETSVPAELVEAFCAATVADAAGGHQRMQKKHCRRSNALCASEKIRARDVVRWELRLDRAGPCDGNPAVSECFSESRVAMSGVIFFGSKALACAYVTLHLLATAPV